MFLVLALCSISNFVLKMWSEERRLDEYYVWDDQLINWCIGGYQFKQQQKQTCQLCLYVFCFSVFFCGGVGGYNVSYRNYRISSVKEFEDVWWTYDRFEIWDIDRNGKINKLIDLPKTTFQQKPYIFSVQTYM